MATKKTPRPSQAAKNKLFDQTQKIIYKLEKQLKMPLLTYWHSYDGSVCDNDVKAIFEVLERTKMSGECAIFIKSDGGNGQASLRIVNLMRNYMSKIHALVPLQCASAATMVALGADKIHMGPLSNLTAVDTSLKHQLSPISNTNYRVPVSLDELNRVVKLWKSSGRSDKNPYEALYQYIHPLVIGAIDRSESLSTMLCEEILSFHLKNKEKIKKISHVLNSEYPSHDYPIMLREAKRIGLNAVELDSNINALLLELNDIYSEMGEETRKDYDQHNYYTNSVVNIMESRDVQMMYQMDKEWHYILEEKRWRSTNDESGWYMYTKTRNGASRKRLYIN